MKSLEEARAVVLEGCIAKLPEEEVELDGALGKVLAEEVVAGEPVPPFANSGMDGYAVCAGDVAAASPESPVRLKVVGTLLAGDSPRGAVGRGEALRIMTGAPFPDGADAVAIVESTTSSDDAVLVSAPAPAGAHIRPAGADVQDGQSLFGPGTMLTPGHLGVLASIGRVRVRIKRTPVVGVMSTGDELVDSGRPLRPGEIRDSNRHTLLGLLRRDGFTPVDLGVVPDDERVLRQRLDGALEGCDAILTSGGVSMGAADFVRKVLEELGDMAWMQISIRPGKPFAFGLLGGTPTFGLPGNPVSSMVSYELLARPGLRALAGLSGSALYRPVLRATADEGFARKTDGRDTYARVEASVGDDGAWHVVSTGGQGSNLLFPMAKANALAIVPDGGGVPAGETVGVMLLDYGR